MPMGVDVMSAPCKSWDVGVMQKKKKDEKKEEKGKRGDKRCGGEVT